MSRVTSVLIFVLAVRPTNDLTENLQVSSSLKFEATISPLPSVVCAIFVIPLPGSKTTATRIESKSCFVIYALVVLLLGVVLF
jgi:hypothetical protein